MYTEFLAIASLCLLVACSQSPVSTSREHNALENGGVTILTTPIVSDTNLDPYSVQNMNKALQQRLLAKGEDNSQNNEDTLQLEPNYLYVRFFAKGKQGEAQLKAYDTSLVLFKHPMDYKPIQKPVVFVDSTLPDTVISYFATVPFNYSFGETEYEIIKELFLVEPLDGEQEHGAHLLTKKKLNTKNAQTVDILQKMGITLEDVALESLKRTGNLKERLEGDASLTKQAYFADSGVAWSLPGKTWKPNGKLQFKDDVLGVQPLVGVRVTGGYSYYWRQAHTNSKGEFSIPERWSYSINYEANFDNPQFLLEDGHSRYKEDLEIEKNGTKSAWNTTFEGNHARWCVVWTAAYNYWHGENGGLKRPRQNTWWNQSLDIWVYHKNDTDYDADVYDKNSDGEYGYSPVTERIAVRAHKRTSRSIYTITIHEIAHSSNYWNMETKEAIKPQVLEYYNLPKILKETYAKGVEWYLTNRRYGGGWRPIYSKDYTGLIEDLVDTDRRFADRAKVGDSVSGFTVPQIESVLFKCTKWSELKNRLKSSYPSDKGGRKYTKSAMDELFTYWEKK
jgi:hypothetical protein